MRLLDLFCGAGGAAVGYHRAGFDEIVGVDIAFQKNYPFTFIQADAMTFRLDGFDAIHASPPCQFWVDSANRAKHGDLITPLRPRLLNVGVPFVIENVDSCTALREPLMLCGTMFGIKVIRHRLFETSVPVGFAPYSCCHNGYVTRGDFAGVYGRGARGRRWGQGIRDKRPFRWGQVPDGYDSVRDWWSEAMGIDWMTRDELTQAIPPAYTEYIGRQLLRQLAT